MWKIISLNDYYFSNPNGKKIVCGDWNLDTIDTNEETLPITKIINHPEFDALTLKNDIAVLKVAGSFTCKQGNIFPSCIASKNVRHIL